MTWVYDAVHGILDLRDGCARICLSEIQHPADIRGIFRTFLRDSDAVLHLPDRLLEGGIFTVWLVFVCSWGCDTCAYCVGMLIGKHKMAPVLSPKKSVEGGIGGILGAELIGVLYALAINHWGNAGADIPFLCDHRSRRRGDLPDRRSGCVRDQAVP